MNLKKIISEINNIDTLNKILEKYREHTNWTDWYISGGCYNFAHALYKFMNNNAKLWAIQDDISNLVHVGVYIDNHYCDYNGCVKNKNDILDHITTQGKIKWNWITIEDLISEHNYSYKEVKNNYKFQ